MTPREVMESVVSSVRRAAKLCSDIEFSPQDATRSDPDFVVEVCRAAVAAGATTINIPDTVGYATPADFVGLMSKIYTEVRGGNDDVIISTHCHNDLGLAVANSLSAVQAGARQVEGAINGLGERAGNTSTEEVIMALKTRQDYFDVEIGADTTELFETSRLVSRLTGYPVQYNKAIVGRNAFSHESGIHQHGVLRNRETYEIMDAADETVQFQSIHVSGGSQEPPVATVEVERNGKTESHRSTGDGMVDATFQALRKAFHSGAVLVDYRVNPLTAGADAMAAVDVIIRDGSDTHAGRGVSTDVVEGSARAFVAALNKAAMSSAVVES
jgi:isopropylmalate/homocitrate/citramalate synthase